MCITPKLQLQKIEKEMVGFFEYHAPIKKIVLLCITILAIVFFLIKSVKRNKKQMIGYGVHEMNKYLKL